MVHEVTTQDEFNQTLSQNEVVIYDFFATWCGPCRAIAPQVQKFADEFTNVKVFKLDIDKVPSVAQSQKISAMPTFKLYKNGQEVSEVVGANPPAIKALFTQ
jgi:thioredoxin 1